MKKITLSIAIIGIVGVATAGMTMAYFSDTEISTGNTITAGTINLKVNGEDGDTLTQVVTIDDFKPGYEQFIGKRIVVEGNPSDVFLKVEGIETTGGIEVEPELVEENGEEKDNIDAYIYYDLSISFDDLALDSDSWESIISLDEEITLADIEDMWIKLYDNLEPDTILYIRQSFHFNEDVTNWAQGDDMVFNEQFMAQQVEASSPIGGEYLLLDNKDDSWDILMGDGISGVLKYNCDSGLFNFEFIGRGLTPETGYSLIYFNEPYPGSPAELIGFGTPSASGELSLSGSVAMTHDNAKVWLILSDDFDGIEMTAWNPESYLYEHNLIDICHPQPL